MGGRAFLGGSGGGADIRARAGAGIKEAHVPKVLKRGAVGGQAFGLAQHGAGPVEPEPGEIVEYLRLVFGAAAGRVEIVDAQQETPARRAGHVMRQQGRIGMAQMQGAGGGWGEACGEAHEGMRSAVSLSQSPQADLARSV